MNGRELQCAYVALITYAYIVEHRDVPEFTEDGLLEVAAELIDDAVEKTMSFLSVMDVDALELIHMPDGFADWFLEDE